MSSDDEVPALVRRARASDPDAWEALYRLAYPRLSAYAARRLPGAAEVEDAVSETMTRAYALVGSYRAEGAGFLAWLYGICRNVVLEAQRSASRISAVAVPDVVSGSAGPLEHVLADEEAEQVRSAFARLSPEDQEILELRVVGGLEADAVGVVVGKRPGAVRTAQYRALARLRQQLEEVTR